MATQANPTVDPFAGIATPVQTAPSSTTDPFASIATPISGAPAQSTDTSAQQLSVLDRSIEGAKQFAAPIMDLMKPPETPTEQLVHAIGGGGGALAAYRTAKNIVSSVDNAVKSTPAQYKQAAADVQRAVQDFHNKDYRNALSDAVSAGAGVGVVPGGQTTRELSEGARPGGNLATPLTRDALIAGTALIGGEAAAPEEAGTVDAAEAANAASRLRVNPFRAKVQAVLASPEAAGEAAAQPIAQAGVRTVAPTVGPSLRSGIDVQTPLAAAKTLYRTVDEAAKTNFQDLYAKLDAAQDDARVAASGSPEEAKAQLNIKNTEDAIADAKALAAKSGVTDVDKTLAQADAKYTEAQANKDFNSKFFGNVVEGDVRHGAPEAINVKKAIDVLQNMDKPNRYGVSRLRQTSLGEDGAFKLKQVLYDAQNAGKTALDARALRNTILKWGIPSVSGALGLGYELTK